MGNPVVTSHVPGLGTPECESCSDLDPNATRRQARDHAAKHGHYVRYAVENATIYDGLSRAGRR